MTKSKATSKELSFQEMQEEVRSSFEYHLEGFRYDLTEQIAVALKHSGLTKTQFAEKLGVSKGRITQLLDGSNNFTLETLVRISEVLKTEMRLTLRPRGWEQLREFTKTSYHPLKDHRVGGWAHSDSQTLEGVAMSITTSLPKVNTSAFSSPA
jgi:transcriptional regulator with XRE-family HTH domain